MDVTLIHTTYRGIAEDHIHTVIESNTMMAVSFQQNNSPCHKAQDGSGVV